MTTPLRCVLLAFAMFLSAEAAAQAKDWKTVKSDNDAFTTRYLISERTEENGQRVPLIEYEVTTTAAVRMEDCVALMKDVPRHKALGIADASKEVGSTDGNESVVYYYLNAPWPLPDSDIVVRMAFAEDAAEKTAVFTQVAAPSLYEPKKVRRFKHYDMAYRFKDLGEGRTEVTLTASMSPAMKVPQWMLKAAFPESAVKVVRNIVKLAGKGS